MLHAVVNQKQFAKMMGVTQTTVRSWRYSGMPAVQLPGGDYRIDPDAAKAWIATARGAQPQPTPDSLPGPAPVPLPLPSAESPEKRRERMELARIAVDEARAHSLRIRNRQYSAKWWPRSFLFKELAAYLHAARQRWRYMPDAMAPALVGKDAGEIRDLLYAKVREILDEICEDMDRHLDDSPLTWLRPDAPHEDDEVPAQGAESNDEADDTPLLEDLEALDDDDDDDEVDDGE